MATAATVRFEEALEMGPHHCSRKGIILGRRPCGLLRQFCSARPNKVIRAVVRIKRSFVTGMEIQFAEALGLEARNS